MMCAEGPAPPAEYRITRGYSTYTLPYMSGELYSAFTQSFITFVLFCKTGGWPILPYESCLQGPMSSAHRNNQNKEVNEYTGR